MKQKYPSLYNSMVKPKLDEEKRNLRTNTYNGPSSCGNCIRKGDCTFTDWGYGANKKMVFVVLEKCWLKMTSVDKKELEARLKQEAAANGLGAQRIGVILSRGKDKKGYLLMDKEIIFP